MVDIQTAQEIFENNNGVLRTSEAIQAGIAPPTLYAMLDKGIIIRIERGIYQLAKHPLSVIRILSQLLFVTQRLIIADHQLVQLSPAGVYGLRRAITGRMVKVAATNRA